MSLACEVLLPSDDHAMLDLIDAFLASNADRIGRTRKGRVWSLWIDGMPIHVMVVGPSASIELSTACDDALGYAALRRLAGGLAATCGGLDSEPI